MLGLGVVLCALGLPASHHKSHKSHKHDSDAAAPPGHELPASAKTHAVSKHKAVKHTAKSHANSHHAPAHAKHHAKIREDHANAAAKAAAKGHLPPVPKDFVALKDNSQISWEVLQLGPTDGPFDFQYCTDGLFTSAGHSRYGRVWKNYIDDFWIRTGA